MTAPEPLVSVVLPTLGADRYLEQSVASCLGQSLSELELIVVDGGTTGAAARLLGRLGDPRARIVAHPKC